MRRLFTALLLFVSTFSFAQNVSNVKSSREGEDFYAITYHLDFAAIDVKLAVSLDGGKTFSQPLKEVFGDVGKVPSGDHTIYWNLKSEMASADAAKLIFKVSSETSYCFSEPIKLTPGEKKSLDEESSSVTYSADSKFTEVKGRAAKSINSKKALFQFEIGAGLSFLETDVSGALPVHIAPGVMIRGNRFNHYVGCDYGVSPVDDVTYAYLVAEYRLCKKRDDMRFLWTGINFGIGSVPTSSDIPDWELNSVPVIHFLFGYQATKWLNLRLELGYPSITGGIVFNIPNMFYKLR